MRYISIDEFVLISDKLINWYINHQRDLPWRHTKDPYKIWLSEIMLQQTRVDQGMPYYHTFVYNYPTIVDLANANEEQVLRDWQGLGYYSRARNLHSTAQLIRDENAGVFPSNYDAIKKLKGVGDYTAAAIASFAFGLPYAVVDGNVFRVLSRVFGVDTDISSGKAKKEFSELAQALLSKGDPAMHNQAIMEFGALHCTPKKPKCALCPLSDNCFAKAHNKQGELPVKLKKTKVTNRYFNYLVVKKGEQLALQKRGVNQIWASMYEFPLLESTHQLSSDELVGSFEGNKIKRIKQLSETKHILSHQRIFCVFWEVVLTSNGLDEYQYFELEELKALPKSVLIDNFLSQFYF